MPSTHGPSRRADPWGATLRRPTNTATQHTRGHPDPVRPREPPPNHDTPDTPAGPAAERPPPAPNAPATPDANPDPHTRDNPHHAESR